MVEKSVNFFKILKFLNTPNSDNIGLNDLTFNNFQNDINLIFKKIVIFFKLILDFIANGYRNDSNPNTRKYQRWILFTVLISILILIYLFIKYFNLFNINGLEKKLEEKLYLSSGVNDIKDVAKENRERVRYYNNNPHTNRSYEDRNKDFSVMTKGEIVLILVLSGIFILTFLFFVYRNNPENKITNYSESNKFFIDYNNDKAFNSKKFKDSLSNPLFNLFKFTGILLGIILLFFILISLVIYCLEQFNITYYILLYLFGFLSIVTIIAIIFKLIPKLNDTIQKLTENLKGTSQREKEPIIKTFLLFLPCLLILLAEDLHKDFKFTPSPVFILLIILLILVISIFALPALYKFINTLNQNDLLLGGGPIYLNNKTILGYYQNLNKKDIYNYNLVIPKEKPDFDKAEQTDNFFKENGYDFKFLKSVKDTYNKKKKEEDPYELINLDDNPILKNKIKLEKMFKGFTYKLFEKDINGKYNILTNFDPQYESKNKNPYNYTYSLSFYLYLNPQDTNTNISYTEDAEILNYAEKPVIYYNGKSREIIIKSRTFNNKGNQLDTIYRSDNIKYQKWSYFVINYHDNIIDVFIDGRLVASKKNVSPYLVGDYVSVGQNNGIHGSIKDIYYFNMIKPPDDIEFLSKLIKN